MSREIAAGEYRLQSGPDIRTTMIYTHVLDNTRPDIESPADRLARIRPTDNSDQTGEKKPAP